MWMLICSVIGGSVAATITYAVLNRRKAPPVEPQPDSALGLPYVSKRNVRQLRARIYVTIPTFTQTEVNRLEHLRWLIQRGQLSEF